MNNVFFEAQKITSEKGFFFPIPSNIIRFLLSIIVELSFNKKLDCKIYIVYNATCHTVFLRLGISENIFFLNNYFPTYLFPSF